MAPGGGRDVVPRHAPQHELEYATLAAEGRGLLMATHDIEQARSWDLVLCCNRVQIAFGDPARVLTREVIERTCGSSLVPLPGDQALAITPPHHHDHFEADR